MGDEEDAARPRVTSREATRGSCYEVGENRPARRSTTGRRGERRNETRELRLSWEAASGGSGQPACNGRPARGEAATSSTGTMPQTRGTGQCAGRTPTRVSEGPKRETLQPLRMCPPGRPSGERGSILPVRPLGGCSESEARSYATSPGFGGRESSRFLGRKHWKSRKLRQLSPEQPSEWKAQNPVSGQRNLNCSHRFSAHFAPM